MFKYRVPPAEVADRRISRCHLHVLPAHIDDGMGQLDSRMREKGNGRERSPPMKEESNGEYHSSLNRSLCAPFGMCVRPFGRACAFSDVCALSGVRACVPCTSDRPWLIKSIPFGEHPSGTCISCTSDIYGWMKETYLF